MWTALPDWSILMGEVAMECADLWWSSDLCIGEVAADTLAGASLELSVLNIMTSHCNYSLSE